MANTIMRRLALAAALLLAGCFVEPEKTIVEPGAGIDRRPEGVWVYTEGRGFVALAIAADDDALKVDLIRYEPEKPQIVHNRFRVRTTRIADADYFEAEHLGPHLFWSPQTLVRKFIARYELASADRLALAFPGVSAFEAAVRDGRLAGVFHGGVWERAVRLGGDAATLRAHLAAMPSADYPNKLVFRRVSPEP